MDRHTLHYAPDNASLIIRLAIDQLGCAFDTVLVDRARSAQRDPEYLAINPNGLIPTLITPDGAMFETAAILLWLDEQHGDLLPTDGADRAAALKWLVWIANTLHPSYRMLFYPDQYTNSDIEDLRAPTQARITAHLRLLADANDSPWLDGTPCAMSWYLAPLLRWSALYGGPAWFDLADYPRLMAFARSIETLPSVARAIAAEGLGPTPFSDPILSHPPEGSAL
jgi:glutathione S-transferase